MMGTVTLNTLSFLIVMVRCAKPEQIMMTVVLRCVAVTLSNSLALEVHTTVTKAALRIDSSRVNFGQVAVGTTQLSKVHLRWPTDLYLHLLYSFFVLGYLFLVDCSCEYGTTASAKRTFCSLA